jgi:peroxiredoxin
MIQIAFGMVLPWLLVGVLCWLFAQLIRQNGRILLRLEAIEERVGTSSVPAPAQAQAEAPAEGLPVGSAAPDFELPDLAGKRHSLAEFRGRRVLVMFFGPRCGFCTEMLPKLAETPLAGSGGAPMPLVVTTGSVEENRPLFEQHNVRCPVLIQKQMEVASRYQAYGTPMGYLIDEQGAIASRIAVGSEALLALLGAEPAAPAANNGQGAAANGKSKRSKGNRPLATSRLKRDGLTAGTPAPGFRLPRVEGGEIALEDFCGRSVLLVFSDPQCGPCDELAPQLEQVHRQASGLQVLMIGRRDREANRQKVAQHGLTFPVALQKNWEVSLLYAMFATPIGYLIDAQGVVRSDVAVGVGPILALASSAGAPAGDAGEGQGVCAEAAGGESSR